MIRKILIIVLAISLVVELAGCGPLKKKFTRKKKEEKPPPVYYELEKYVKESNIVLYKRHYLYWKTWQEELINKIGQSYKKDMRCIQEIISNLQDMRSLLIKEKADKLKPYIDEMQSVKAQLNNKFITHANRNRVKRSLERAYRHIKREFSYKKVQDYVLPDKDTD